MVKDSQALEEVTQIVESNPGDVQNPTAHSPEQPAYEPGLSRALD